MLSRLDELRRPDAGPAAHVRIAVQDDPLAPYDDVRIGVDTINANSDRIGALRSKLAHAVRDDDQRAIMADRLARDNADLAPGSTLGQMRSNLLATQAQAFQGAIQRYQDQTQRFNDDLKRKIARQARIVNADVTDAEIEQVLQGGDPSMLKP